MDISRSAILFCTFSSCCMSSISRQIAANPHVRSSAQPCLKGAQTIPQHDCCTAQGQGCTRLYKATICTYIAATCRICPEGSSTPSEGEPSGTQGVPHKGAVQVKQHLQRISPPATCTCRMASRISHLPHLPLGSVNPQWRDASMTPRRAAQGRCTLPQNRPLHPLQPQPFKDPSRQLPCTCSTLASTVATSITQHAAPGGQWQWQPAGLAWRFMGAHGPVLVG